MGKYMEQTYDDVKDEYGNKEIKTVKVNITAKSGKDTAEAEIELIFINDDGWKIFTYKTDEDLENDADEDEDEYEDEYEDDDYDYDDYDYDDDYDY